MAENKKWYWWLLLPLLAIPLLVKYIYKVFLSGGQDEQEKKYREDLKKVESGKEKVREKLSNLKKRETSLDKRINDVEKEKSDEKVSNSGWHHNYDDKL